MSESFSKELKDGEIRWNFIHIPKHYRELFPKRRPFKIDCKGEIFQVSINKAGRIVSKQLFKKLNPRKKSILTVTRKSENEFIVDLLGESIQKIVFP
jgi:hypothetical protein